MQTANLGPLPEHKIDQNSETSIKNGKKRVVNYDKVRGLCLELVPLTLPYHDATGRILQLWKSPRCGLIGAVLSQPGQITIIHANKIINPLNANEQADDLVRRLESTPLKKWDIVFDTRKLSFSIWPHLEAAGKYDNKSYNETIQDANQRLNNIQTNGGLNRSHYTACQTEGKSRPLMREGKLLLRSKNDRPFDHRNDVWESQKAGRNLITDIKHRLKRDNLTSEQRKELEKLIVKTGKILDESQKYAPLARPIAPKLSPALKQFEQLVQQKNLTDSFNSTHRQNPMPAKGGAGDIGGVACGTEYIEGLFDGPEAIFEHDHLFCVPTLEDGSMPFSDLELRQILRELCIGIYVHDTIPFFSLHFNQNGDLVPVIHPVYVNTLVGRVISMLDYIMKGYLNGGIYQEQFIDRWEKDPNWNGKSASALQQIIAFEQYCQKHLEGDDKIYCSLSDIHAGIKAKKNLKGVEKPESKILKQFAGFSNSFRIIAKQNSIQKEGNLFVIDADFDVFYTINPSPSYKKALDAHLQGHGASPLSHQSMITAYKLMCERIHDHMVKMPLCRPFFSMLSVINFFSGYFSTLKKHRKVPILPAFESLNVKGCPSILPHLPIKKTFIEMPKCNLQQTMNKWIGERLLMSHFVTFFRKGIISNDPLSMNTIEPNWTSECVMPLQSAIYENIVSSFSPQMQRMITDKGYKRYQEFLNLSQEMSLQIAGQIFKGLSGLIDAYMEKKQLKSTPWWLREISIGQSGGLELEHIVRQFLQKIPKAFPNKSEPLFKEPIAFTDTRIKSQMSFDEVEEGKRVVGGCGMELKVQAVEASPKASQILQESWSKLISLAPESWKDLGGNRGAVFRLSFEDAPAVVSDSYEWMESLLFLRAGERSEEIETRLKLEQAILDEDSEEFSSLINQTKNHLPDRYERTLLHFAAQVNDPLYMESLLSRGLSHLSKDLHGYLPIHYAAMSGSLQPLQLLLETDVNKTTLNALSLNHSTPLVVAIQHNQYEVVRLLLGCGATFHPTLDGYNPLHCALHQGDLPIINLLLAHSKISAYINEMAEEEGTPLMLACELDSAGLVQQMIQLGADPKAQRKDGLTALEVAFRRQCLPVLEILLQHVIPTDRITETAAKEGSIQVFRLLARKKGAYTYENAFHDTLLHIAIRYGNIPVANLLINRCKNNSFLHKKNINGESPFSLACALDLWEIIKCLYEKIAIVDYEPLLQMSYDPLLKKIFKNLKLSFKDLQHCLLKAAEAGNQRLIQNVLIPKGANLHKLEGPNGWKIAHYLAKSDGIDLFVPLIANSKDFLQPLNQEENKTLAYISAENGSSRILKLLLEQMKNQNCSLENHYLDRHLFYAVIEAGFLDQVQFMLGLYPFLSHQILDQKKTTPAHLAAQIGSLEIIKALNERGSNLNAKDAQGFIPLDYAIRLNAKEIVAYLLEQKVKPSVQTFYEAALQENLELLHQLIQQSKHKRLLDIALARAVRDDQTQACLRLLQCNPSLEYVTDKGWTPLLMASARGLYEVIVELLKQNPLDNRAVNDKNPLDLACQNGHAHCVSLLIEAGYDLTDPDASYSKAVCVELGDIDDSYQKNIETFLKALRYGNTESMRTCFNRFNLHEKIFIEHERQKICGTPLLLLLHMDKGEKFQSFIAGFLKETDSNGKLRNKTKETVNGNTCAHLFVMSNISFSPTQKVATIKNHQGQTILHLAAQAPQKVLSRILDQANDLDIDAVDNQGRTALYYAIKSNREDNLQLLIKKGANLNHYDHERMTPLLFACKRQSLSTARILLGAGANPNLVGTKYRIAPLFLAIEAESDAMALTLILHGANCDIRTENGVPLVHQLAVLGKLQLLRLFGAKGLLGIRDNHGLQAIHQAAGQGKSDSVKAIVASDSGTVEANLDINFQEKRNKSIKGITPLHLAASLSDLKTVQILLDANANPEINPKQGQNILSSAANVSTLELFFSYSCSNNPLQLCKALIQAIHHDELSKMVALYNRGVTINSHLVDGYTGFHLACQCGALRCTQWFLQNGADPSLACITGETAFELAAANGSYEQFCLLLEYTEVDVNQANTQGETLMHIAAKKGNLHHIILLVLHGANLEETDSRGFTPLHYAALGGHSKVVQILLLCGTDISKEDVLDLVQDEPTKAAFHDYINLLETAKHKASALHLAVRSQNSLALRLLIHTEEIDQQDEEGTSALHLAVQIAQIPCIKLLIQDGASVDLQDRLGRTALYYACEQNNLAVVEALLEAGADLEIKDHAGLSIRQQISKGVFTQKDELLYVIKTIQEKPLATSQITQLSLGHLWTAVSSFGELLNFQKIADIGSYISQELFCIHQPQNRITNQLHLQSIDEERQIISDCRPLVEILLDLEEKQETSKMALHQLNQLYRAHRAVCRKPLIIDGTDVGMLLLGFQQQFPAFFERNKEKMITKKPAETSSKSSISKDSVPIYSLRNIFIDCKTFKDARSLAVRYLTSLPEKNRLSIDIYIKILNCLDSKQHLTARGKMAFTHQLLHCTTKQDRPISIQYFLSDLTEYLEATCQFCEGCGEGVFFKLKQAKDFKNASLIDQIHLYQLLIALSRDLDLVEIVQRQVENYVSNGTNFTDLVEELENLIPKLPSEIPIENEDLDILLDRFAGNDPQVKFPLTEREIEMLRDNYKAVQSYCHAWKTCCIETLVRKANEIRQQEGMRFEDTLKLIAIGMLAIRIKFPSIYLYRTQVLTVLGLLQGQRNAIAQVTTGEGKSKIVTLLAFVLAMHKRKVHVISSSHELATRDQLTSQNFFNSFRIPTSAICSHYSEAEYFQAEILFGTTSDYQFAILHEMLYFKQIYPENKESPKRFDCAIIDEVDNLTIDTELHGTRAGYPADVTHDWVYRPIFTFVQKFIQSEQDLISNSAVQKLRVFLQNYQDGKFADLLQKLSNHNLKAWLKTAYHAIYNLEENRNYIIGQEETREGEWTKAIFIVDYDNTGNVLETSRWSKGLHEFLEIKHNLEVKRESLTPIALSNSVFYLNYFQLFGLTGTLGSESDRKQIKELYEMNSFDVPTHKPQIREDKPSLIVPGELYFQVILEKIHEMHQKKRPQLLICLTIEETLMIEKLLKESGFSFEMLNEIQTKKATDIIGKAGLPGAITVATNTAGRGVDIQLTQESINFGGLHVMILFYPKSGRVEYQARGRAGRQGEPGSSEIVLSAGKLGKNIFSLEDLNRKRTIGESFIKSIHYFQSKINRSIFSKAKEFFSQVQQFEQFINNDKSLNLQAGNFSDRLIFIEEQPDLSDLHPYDRRIAEDAVRLLTDGTYSTIHWKNFFQQAGKRLIDKMINYWSCECYEMMIEIFNSSKLKDVALLQLELERSKESSEDSLEYMLASSLESQIQEVASQELKLVMQKIDSVLNKRKPHWEKYLSKEGLFQYLYEITNLPPFMENESESLVDSQ